MNFFIDALKNYAEFSGRATRQQFWMYVLFYLIFSLVVGAIDSMLGTGLLHLIYSLALALPSISIGARRLHDTGRTGWWQLIGFIPILGAIVLIVFCVQDSHPDNEYGPNPKAI